MENQDKIQLLDPELRKLTVCATHVVQRAAVIIQSQQ